MRTSIIVLNWNTLKYLKECISSIRANTKDYELIIVDNGSIENGTQDYLKTLSIENKEMCFTLPRNMGYGYGNNLGARYASGDYVCFVNSDVVVEENWLEDLIELLENTPTCGAVVPLGNPEYGNIGGDRVKYLDQVKGMYTEDTQVNRITGFCLLMRKSFFNEIGGWNVDFENGNFEDTLLSNEIRKTGKTLWVSAKAKVNHDNPGRSFEANNLKYIDTLELNKKIYQKKLKNG